MSYGERIDTILFKNRKREAKRNAEILRELDRKISCGESWFGPRPPSVLPDPLGPVVIRELRPFNG